MKIQLQDPVEEKLEQLWKKGDIDQDGYFTLENAKVPMVLTLTNMGLKLKR